MKTTKYMDIKNITTFTGICQFEEGTKVWFADGKCHRVDGPAIEYIDGSKEWIVDGKYHRLDGPAIELNNGSKMWFVNGKYHRLDGPAIDCSDGSKSWWINDVKYSEKYFNEHPLVVGYKLQNSSTTS
jgi:hypothetical protein